MRLTVIGCAGSFPGPESPASCYLVEHDGFAVLLDLYLWRPAEALEQFEAYVTKSGTADKQVSGWIAELKRRVGDFAQTAGVQP